MVGKRIFNTNFSKVTVGLVLVMAVIVSLWFASPAPVRAVETSLPTLPSIMYSGSSYSFHAQVDINSGEAIPINSLRLDIRGPTPVYAIFRADGTITEGSPQFVSISCIVAPYSGTVDRYGYGYGYKAPAFGYFSESWGSGYGYGYGYGVASTTQAKYLVTINTAGMVSGSYSAQLAVNTGPADTRFLSAAYSFTLALADGGGVVPPPAPTPGVTNLTTVVDPTGTFTATVTANSADQKVALTIDVGTKGLTAAGAPLRQISIQPMTAPPSPPMDTSAVGLVYDFGPDGATFDRPLAITLTYNPAQLPVGASESSLYIAWWDASAGKWVKLVSTVNPVTHTITATVTHFTAFSVIVPSRPAAFTTSSLAIPAQVEVGKLATIRALVTNTGDLSGSYNVVFKVNNEVVEIRTVTLAGGANQLVTFTTIQSKAGTYVVAVDTMLGSLVVKEAPVPPVIPPKPAAFTVRQVAVSPTAAEVGEGVTIVASIANTGEVEGTYTATLKVNGVVESTKSVTVGGGRSADVTFTVAKSAAGSYQVEVGGQTGTFTVTTPPTSWWIWLIVGLVVVAIAVVTFFLLRRRAVY